MSNVYCSHRVRVLGPPRAFEAVLLTARPGAQPLVQLSYSTPVQIDAGPFPRLYLMMHCARGAARATQQHREVAWRAGQTVPFSAGLETQLWFDRDFVQRGVRLDFEKLEKLCARFLGEPLSLPLQFELSPFSGDLERIWQQSLQYVWSLEDAGAPLAETARAALDEYLLTLLLHGHPHNYSSELARSAPTPVPGLVRRAERFMSDHAGSPITVSVVAEALGVSVRSLQQGFRQWRGTTPLAYLRRVRLERVRHELLHGEDASVTEVALRYGFAHLGRFSHYYRLHFGEAPSVTWRQNRRRRSTSD